MPEILVSQDEEPSYTTFIQMYHNKLRRNKTWVSLISLADDFTQFRYMFILIILLSVELLTVKQYFSSILNKKNYCCYNKNLLGTIRFPFSWPRFPLWSMREHITILGACANIEHTLKYQRNIIAKSQDLLVLTSCRSLTD